MTTLPYLELEQKDTAMPSSQELLLIGIPFPTKLEQVAALSALN